MGFGIGGGLGFSNPFILFLILRMLSRRFFPFGSGPGSSGGPGSPGGPKR